MIFFFFLSLQFNCFGRFPVHCVIKHFESNLSEGGFFLSENCVSNGALSILQTKSDGSKLLFYKNKLLYVEGWQFAANKPFFFLFTVKSFHISPIKKPPESKPSDPLTSPPNRQFYLWPHINRSNQNQHAACTHYSQCLIIESSLYEPNNFQFLCFVPDYTTKTSKISRYSGSKKNEGKCSHFFPLHCFHNGLKLCYLVYTLQQVIMLLCPVKKPLRFI